MKKVPRNRAIEIVLQGHIDDIENWVIQGEREQLKKWLKDTLCLGRKSVEDMIKEYNAYFDLDEDYNDE